MNPTRRELLRGAAAASLSPALLKLGGARAAEGAPTVPEGRMRAVYEAALTPYKQGVVIENDLGFADGPCVFRLGSHWYMTYFVLQEAPRNGYTTELARSEDLLHWERVDTLLPFRDGAWDSAQAAGSIALPDVAWGGAGRPHTYAGRYWMSYFGDDQEGFEPGPLSIGMASSRDAFTWTRSDTPVLSPNDPDARWWENYRQFRSTVIYDPRRTLGAPFVMYYNARGGAITEWSERIGMALSTNLTDWVRYRTDPVIANEPLDFAGGISGDPQIVRMGDLWVMFYFGAFWRNGAFNTFACSYDLVNWTKWSGPMLLAPSRGYDRQYAHKPWLVEHEGTVHHFYTAVGDKRSIAVATSRDLGGSQRVTASYTHWETSEAAVRDGDPSSLWTAYESPNFSDWIELTFPRPRRVSGLRVQFADDGQSIQPPSDYHVECALGRGWAMAGGRARSPGAPAAGANTVRFRPVTTSRLRLYVQHRRGGIRPTSGGIYSGVREIEVLEESE